MTVSYEPTPERTICTPTKRSGPITALGVLMMLGFISVSGAMQLTQWLETPDPAFMTPTTFVVSEGSGAALILRDLADADLLRNYWYGVYMMRTTFTDETLKAGTYTFTSATSTTGVLTTLIAGNPIDNTVTLTHREGERAELLAERITEVVENFDAEVFLELAIPYEGKLFPETYFIPKDFSELELVTLLLDTYSEQTDSIKDQIIAHPLGEYGVLTLASIIEREANDETSMKMVSGILQNRLAINMALQTDASIEYVLEKPLTELTPDDLKQESPYNTYLNPGLPPTPIGNPGLTAIMAVLEPTPSDFLYYITGNDGEFYYAKDFDQHRRNIAQYLR